MPTLSRKLKEAAKGFWRFALEQGQKLGVSITPHHFYSDIPDFRELRRESHWKRPYSFHGVQGADMPSQLAFVRDCCTPFLDRLRQGGIHAHACAENGEPGYGPAEAAFLYAFIRRHKPARIVQVGSGVSTAVIRLAAKDENYSPTITCVDPYPTPYQVRMNDAGHIRLVAEKAQVVDLSVLTDMGESGFFFVDSTHTLRPGSEVTRMILEVLPRLPKSTWVHFHDIWWPYDYRPNILSDALFFWHETVLLAAFMSCNPRYAIQASLNMLHTASPATRDELRGLLVDYRPASTEAGLATSEGDYPSSVILRAVN